MKNLICNPLLAPFLTVSFLLLCGIIGIACNPADVGGFYENDGGLEIITYTGYAVALVTALFLIRDYVKTPKQTSYFLFLVLWLAALLREMGIQHWLTSTDTTAIKLRFFTNPNNPLSEKLVAGFLVLLVFGIVLKLLIEYMPKIIRGFFEVNPLYWTVCTFGTVGLVSKFMDRFPSNYYKVTGERLDSLSNAWFKLFEEGGEATLPLLFTIGLIQFHLMYRQGKVKH